MTNKPLKRFIAGAICPQCKLQDKTVIYRDVEREYTECVQCGYQLQQPLAPTGAKKLAAIPVRSKTNSNKNDG